MMRSIWHCSGKCIRKKYQVKSLLQLISSLLARNLQANPRSEADSEQPRPVA